MARPSLVRGLWHDRVASASATFLAATLLMTVFGPWLIDPSGNEINLRLRNHPPFQPDVGWLYWLGADSLGRSIIARLVKAAPTTMAISFSTVIVSLLIGATIGTATALKDWWLSDLVMRTIDVLLSIPSLLLAMAVLYILGPSPINVVLILTVTRIPIFARTARAEALEIRERAFVSAARVMGAGPLHLLLRHIAPLVLPTIFAIATLEFAFVMLAESTLTFLGIGIQPPSVSWGLMVAEGREYLSSAWWVSVWPGAAIALVALNATILGNWFRVATDPALRSRLASRAAANA